jgi:hypothetical protein
VSFGGRGILIASTAEVVGRETLELTPAQEQALEVLEASEEVTGDLSTRVVGFDFLHGRLSPHLAAPGLSALRRVKPDGRIVNVATSRTLRELNS